MSFVQGKTYAHDFLQCLQCRLGRLSRIPHRFEQCWNRLIDSLCAHVLLHGIECPRSGGTN